MLFIVASFMLADLAVEKSWKVGFGVFEFELIKLLCVQKNTTHKHESSWQLSSGPMMLVVTPCYSDQWPQERTTLDVDRR
jgi:hypothetical protein